MALDLNLEEMPSNILFDIARNESASREYRKAAVRLMLKHRYPKTDHPDLLLLRQEVEAEIAAENDVQDIVEQAIEAPLPAKEEFGALKASFTTKDL